MLELEYWRELSAINRVIASTSDCASVLDLIVEKSAAYAQADASLLLVVDAHSQAVIAAAVGIDSGKIANFRAPLDERIGLVVSELLEARAEDTFVGVPVLDHGAIRGVLLVYTRRATGAPDEEFLLSALADQAAIVLRSRPCLKLNGRTFLAAGAVDDHPGPKLETLPNYLAAILPLSRQAIAGLNVAELMRESLKTIVSNLGLEYALVLQVLPDGKGLLVHQGIGWRYRTEGIVLGTARSSYPGYTLLRNEPVLVEDLPNETRFRVCQLARDHQAASSISAVIPGRDRPLAQLAPILQSLASLLTTTRTLCS